MIRINRKPGVDWFRVLAELRRVGLSQCEVARLLSIPRNRVKHWSCGKQPRYDDGRALLMLWRRACYSKLSPKGQAKSVQTRNVECANDYAAKRLEATGLSTPALALP